MDRDQLAMVRPGGALVQEKMKVLARHGYWTGRAAIVFDFFHSSFGSKPGTCEIYEMLKNMLARTGRIILSTPLWYTLIYIKCVIDIICTFLVLFCRWWIGGEMFTARKFVESVRCIRAQPDGKQNHCKTTVETRSLGCGLAESDQIIRSRVLRACVLPQNSERKERNSNESTSGTLSFSRHATAEMQAISARLPQTSYSLVIGLRQCIVMLSSAAAAAADVTLVDWLTAVKSHGQNHQRNWTECDTRDAPAFLSRQYHLFTIITFAKYFRYARAIPQIVKSRTMRFAAAIVAIARPTIIHYSWIFNATFRARYTFFSTIRIQSARCSRLWWDGGHGDTSQSNNVSFNFHSFSCDRPPAVCDCAPIVASMSARISIVHIGQIGATIEIQAHHFYSRKRSLFQCFSSHLAASRLTRKMIKSANFSRKHNSCAFVMAVQREWFMADENDYLPVDNKASDLWHASCGDHSCFIGNFTLFIPPPHRNQRMFESNEIATVTQTRVKITRCCWRCRAAVTIGRYPRKSQIIRFWLFSFFFGNSRERTTLLSRASATRRIQLNWPQTEKKTCFTYCNRGNNELILSKRRKREMNGVNRCHCL